MVATESVTAPGTMDLMSERLIFEVIPESELMKERENAGYVPKVAAIDQVPAGTIGEIVISDLSRDVLPIIRYRIGDLISVQTPDSSGGRESQRISVLGRSRNTVLLGNVPLYEMQLTSALEMALGNKLADWRIVQQEGKQTGSDRKYHLFAEPTMGIDLSENDRAGILAAIKTQRAALEQVDVESLIDVIWTERLQQIPVQGDAKSRRIVLTA